MLTGVKQSVLVINGALTAEGVGGGIKGMEWGWGGQIRSRRGGRNGTDTDTIVSPFPDQTHMGPHRLVPAI